MRAVIDTNVLVSALIRPQGRAGPVLFHLSEKTFTLLYDLTLVEELVNVLRRPRLSNKYGILAEDVETVVRLILLHGEPVKVSEQIDECRDPKDNKFLEVAFAGNADVIVSGDKDLLVLDPFRGIAIVPAASFLTRLEGGRT